MTALRYHNVYGPRMPRDTPYAGVASIFRSAIAAGRVPRVFEDGAQRRDFVHVRDVARANVLALESAHAGRVQRGIRHAAQRGGDGRDARRGPGARSPASGVRETSATCSPRPRRPRASSASAPRRTSPPGCASSRPRSCAHDALRGRRPRRVDRVRALHARPAAGRDHRRQRLVLRGRGQRRRRRRAAREALGRRRLLHRARERRAGPQVRGAADRARRARPRRAARGDAALGLRPPHRRQRAHDLDRRRAPCPARRRRPAVGAHRRRRRRLRLRRRPRGDGARPPRPPARRHAARRTCRESRWTRSSAAPTTAWSTSIPTRSTRRRG